jgi:hypothetical protein
MLLFAFVYDFNMILQDYYSYKISDYDLMQENGTSKIQFSGLNRFCTPGGLRVIETLRPYYTGKKAPHLQRCIDFFTSLRKTMEVLSLDPILVDTGQHEPIFDKPRTYADMQNEIATRLSTLPNYQAKVRMVNSEALVQTLPPTPHMSDELLTARHERVKDQTRKLYCRERMEVEEDITQRQETLMQPIIEPPKSRREVV